MGYVYLICFDEKYHHAKHYVGYAEEGIEQRLERHKRGNGSRLLRAVKEAGIDFNIVRVWKDVDRYFERKLKRQKNSKRFCPVCNKKFRRGKSKNNFSGNR